MALLLLPFPEVLGAYGPCTRRCHRLGWCVPSPAGAKAARDVSPPWEVGPLEEVGCRYRGQCGAGWGPDADVQGGLTRPLEGIIMYFKTHLKFQNFELINQISMACRSGGSGQGELGVVFPWRRPGGCISSLMSLWLQ